MLSYFITYKSLVTDDYIEVIEYIKCQIIILQ